MKWASRSLSRRAAVLIGGALLAGAAGLLPFAGGLDEAFDVEVRSVPLRTQTGRLLDENPVGQGFRCDWDGLSRIDVWLTPLAQAEGAQLELVLKADSTRGEVLRRARVQPQGLAGPGDFVPFEFEPLSDSAGRQLWFVLEVPGAAVQSPFSAWTRYHGQPGVEAPWGDRVLPGTVFEGKLIDNSLTPDQRVTWGVVPHPHLAAVAFAFENVLGGRARLEIWDEGAEPASDPPLRTVLLPVEESVRGGYAYFTFEPIVESRWRDMSYRLRVDRAARVVGFEGGPSFKSFHGGTAAGPELLGMTRGSRLYEDRCLVFRARSSPSSALVFERIARRAGWKLWCGALCWVLAAAFAAGLFLRR